MKAEFVLKRDHYRGDTTLGIMYDHYKKHFCYVLEDTVRAIGIKDKKNTAIPATNGKPYRMGVRKSPKYGEVVVIYDRQENGLYFIERDIKFTQVLAHGGNHDGHTEGCLLVNRTRDKKNNVAQGSMKEDILNLVKDLKGRGFEVLLHIENLPQEA